MALFTQSTFPGLYSAFQYMLGGTIDKRRLSLMHYSQHKTVLEVGCSIGNIAMAFRILDCDYLGVDIDDKVITYASKRYVKYSHMRFRTADLLELSENKTFDYILFAGVCHHIPTPQLKEYLDIAAGMLSSTGSPVVVDPVTPDGSVLMQAYVRADNRAFIRTQDELIEILYGVPRLTLLESKALPVGATPFSWPIVAKFVVARMEKIPKFICLGIQSI
jgi:ubiquinone/menaquinone biosynthesis C-methylase UbiE